MKNLFIKIIITLVFLVTFAVCNAEEPTSSVEEDVKMEFEQEQFLVQIQKNGNKEMIRLYLFIIDHSIYSVNVSTWNAFCQNYKNCLYAYRAYRQGWDIEFDDILN